MDYFLSNLNNITCTGKLSSDSYWHNISLINVALYVVRH